MPEHFPHVRGSFSIYVGDRGDTIDTVRFVLAFFGEDPTKVIEAFWQEHHGDFVCVPLFGYGAVPRKELCTQQSLVDALRTVKLDPNGIVTQKWKKVCQDMAVAWPKRLQAKAA